MLPANTNTQGETMMSTRTLGSAVIACVLLVGCGAMHPRVEKVSKKLDCDGTRACLVTVTVACKWLYDCDATVDYDLVVVAEKKKIDIDWQLAAEPGFVFAGNGISIDSADFDCKPQGKDRFKCSDANSGFAVVKYSVNITASNSAFGPRGVPAIDPWVINH